MALSLGSAERPSDRRFQRRESSHGLAKRKSLAGCFIRDRGGRFSWGRSWRRENGICFFRLYTHLKKRSPKGQEIVFILKSLPGDDTIATEPKQPATEIVACSLCGAAPPGNGAHGPADPRPNSPADGPCPRSVSPPRAEPRTPAGRGRRHFFQRRPRGQCAKILIEQARHKSSLKHGGQARRLELAEGLAWIEPPASDFLALDEAIQQLQAEDAHLAEIVELRYFTGLSVEEAASVVGESVSTLKRDWRHARAWLARRLTEGTA